MLKWSVLSVRVAMLGVLGLAGSFAMAQQVETEKDPASQLYVRTVPSGAKIFIDGQPKGPSDRLIELPKGTGRVDLEIHLDGYKAEREGVAIAEGKITRVVVRLKKGESLTVGTDPNPSDDPYQMKQEPKVFSGRMRIQGDTMTFSPADVEETRQLLRRLAEDVRREPYGRYSRETESQGGARQPRTVRLVIGSDQMTFEGKETTWEKLPELLEAVPERENTVLEIAFAPGNMNNEKREEAIAKAVALSTELNFKYVSFVGIKSFAGGKLFKAPKDGTRKFVRLVIGKDTMTFEGQEISWEDLPKLLEAVPDRENTVLEIALAPEDLSKETLDKAIRGVRLASQFGFEYLSHIGVHPLGSKGSAPQPRKPAEPTATKPTSAFEPPTAEPAAAGRGRGKLIMPPATGTR
jgi:hypothetical protein